MKILVLMADPDEYDPFKEKIKNLITEEFTFHTMPALRFTYKTFDVTVICFGIGKVHAATGAALALAERKYDIVLNTGWSGAVSGVHKGDIIIGDYFVECDYDMSPIGYAPGQKPYREEIGYTCESEIFSKLIASETFPAGRFGTGDIFLTDPVRSARFKELFGINTFDMESAALAEVCTLMKVPFISVRKISDDANDAAGTDYRGSIRGDDTAFSEIIIATLDAILKA